VEVLGTRLIVVMGHKRCGAVIATIQGGETPGKIKTLVQAIQPAVDGTKDQTGDKVDNAVRENIKLGVEKLKIGSRFFLKKC